jgi:hypothetical protein
MSSPFIHSIKHGRSYSGMECEANSFFVDSLMIDCSFGGSVKCQLGWATYYGMSAEECIHYRCSKSSLSSLLALLFCPLFAKEFGRRVSVTSRISGTRTPPLNICCITLWTVYDTTSQVTAGSSCSSREVDIFVNDRDTRKCKKTSSNLKDVS